MWAGHPPPGLDLGGSNGPLSTWGDELAGPASVTPASVLLESDVDLYSTVLSRYGFDR